MGVADKCEATAPGELFTHEEISITVHEIDGHATVDEITQRRFHLRAVGVRIVVADPRFEQVAENVQRIRFPSGPRQERQKLLTNLGLVGFEAVSAIRQIIDVSLRDAGVEINVVMELRSIPAIVRMVLTTGNLGFVSSIGVQTDSAIRVLDVRGLDIRRRLAVVSRRRAALSPASARFVERLHESAAV